MNLNKSKVKEINSKLYLESRSNPTDTIKMDIPLFIRMLEYAREDAKTDMDLHNVTEKAISLSSSGKTLTMAEYEHMVDSKLSEKKLTTAEKQKKEEIVKSMKKSFKGDKGAMYAIATSRAKKLAEANERGLMVFGRTTSDNNAIADMIDNSDFQAEWNAREGYWLFPEDESTYDELELELEREFNERGINARFEGIFEVDKPKISEAYVPDNIKSFAKRKGVSSLVNKAAGWAEKIGKRITGGTAIGKDYSTLILDMGYQTSDIYINTDDNTIELYGEEVNSFPEFKKVYMDKMTQDQIEHDKYIFRQELGLEEVYDEHNKENLNEGSDENYDIFMDGVLDVLVKDKLITIADIDALNSGEADDLMDALHDEWKGFEDYEETGQAISRSDLNLAARAVAKKIGKLEEGLPKGYWAKKIPGGKMEENIQDNDILGDMISDMLKYKTKEEVLQYLRQQVALYSDDVKDNKPKISTAKQKSMVENIISKLKGK